MTSRIPPYLMEDEPPYNPSEILIRYPAPWRADGCKVLDAKNKIITTLPTETLAQFCADATNQFFEID